MAITITSPSSPCCWPKSLEHPPPSQTKAGRPLLEFLAPPPAALILLHHLLVLQHRAGVVVHARLAPGLGPDQRVQLDVRLEVVHAVGDVLAPAAGVEGFAVYAREEVVVSFDGMERV